MVTRGREKFEKMKPLFLICIKIASIFPIFIRKKIFRVFRNTQGVVGLGLRYIFLKSLAKNCGDNVSIHPNVHILFPDRLTLGNNVSIHPMCYIDAVGELEIGDDVSIAHGTTILSSNHIFSNLDIPIKDQGLTYKKTKLENDIWLGAKSTILSGITIRKGTIVGANAIVTKNFEKGVILAGNPAKIIKHRRKS